MNFIRRRRKSASTVIYIPVAAFLIVLFAAFGTSAFLKVLYIEVAGVSMYTEEDIIVASGILPSNNLLFLDVSAVQARICGEMPYISDVVVTRVLPDTISINITESKAVATVRYQNDVLVIDSSCRVLEYTDAVPAGLIEVRGFSPFSPETGSAMRAEPGGETRLQYLTDVLKAMDKEGVCDDVSYVDVSNIVGINFWYLGRFEVTLGGSSNVQQKLSRLPQIVETINEDHGPEEKGRITMSDSSGRSTFYPYR